jgi:hypothetical protein
MVMPNKLTLHLIAHNEPVGKVLLTSETDFFRSLLIPSQYEDR